MIDSKVYNLVELYSQASDELFDIFFTKSNSYVNFCNDSVIDFITKGVKKLIDLDKKNNIIFKSCIPYNNWRSEHSDYKEIYMVSDRHPQLGIFPENSNSSVEAVFSRLKQDNDLICIEGPNLDYFDFRLLAENHIGSMFLEKSNVFFDNFLDNNVYYYKKEVIYKDIPDYINDWVYRTLKIKEII